MRIYRGIQNRKGTDCAFNSFLQVTNHAENFRKNMLMWQATPKGHTHYPKAGDKSSCCVCQCGVMYKELGAINMYKSWLYVHIITNKYIILIFLLFFCFDYTYFCHKRRNYFYNLHNTDVRRNFGGFLAFMNCRKTKKHSSGVFPLSLQQ